MTDLVLPTPLPDDAHKGSAGRVLCMAGSPSFPGAACLVAGAAVRGGAGLVTVALFHPQLSAIVAPVVPEAVYLDVSRTRDLFVGRLPREIAGHEHQVRVVGPGLGRSELARELVRRLVESDFDGPLLLDADALNLLAGAPELLRQHPGPVVITPHPGEAGRLLGRRVPADDDGRVRAAEELAELAGGVCVLKGAGTVVSDGSRSWTCAAGNPGLATAGTGDVLSGLCGAYLAAVGESFSPFDAARLAVHVHARAGDFAAAEVGRRGLVARDVIEYLPAAQREVGLP